MLILTRRVGETLVIGDSITVTVLGIKGTQVRIGVHAPREVRVDRNEVRERMDAEARAAGAPLVPVRDAFEQAKQRAQGME